jgi:chromate transport protein ChrA
MLENLIAIVAVMVVSAFAGYNRHDHSFSQNIFLASLVIGIGLLIWTGTIPYYAVIISALIMVGMFLMGNGESNE